MVPRGEAAPSRFPVAVKLSPFFTVARALRARARPGRRRRPGALQPLLPARHRHRGARRARARCTCRTPRSCCLRLRWLAILSGRVQASLAVTGGVHTAARRRQGGDGGRARRRRWSRRCCSTARSTCGACRDDLDELDGRARVALARRDARQHEPAAAARSRPPTSGRTTCSCCRAGAPRPSQGR